VRPDQRAGDQVVVLGGWIESRTRRDQRVFHCNGMPAAGAEPEVVEGCLVGRVSKDATRTGPGEVLKVAAEAAVDEPESGCAPYIQFCRGEGDSVLGEVSGNRYLHASHRLDKEARRRLAEIGWSRPRPKHGLFNFGAEVDQSRADQLAVMAVTALQEVFAVMHPAFLVGDVQIGEDPDLPHANTVVPPDEPLATASDGRKHLDQLVDQALLPLPGQVPDRDDDGDVRVVSGTPVVFVRTGPHAPVITIWAEVAVEVGDLDRAKFEVAVLNRERPFAKFVLFDDRIVAQVHLPAAPFAPEHLRQMLAMMCALADEVDDDLAVRVRGRRFLEPCDVQETDAGGDSESGGIHPAMLTLLQLDAESPGSVKPALAARVCENDTELLLTLIRWNEAQEIAWRTARDEATDAGDPNDEADVCEHERTHAQRTTKLLRKALRLVVKEGRCERR
jgi:hypothetical protein